MIQQRSTQYGQGTTFYRVCLHCLSPLANPAALSTAPHAHVTRSSTTEVTEPACSRDTLWRARRRARLARLLRNGVDERARRACPVLLYGNGGSGGSTGRRGRQLGRTAVCSRGRWLGHWWRAAGGRGGRRSSGQRTFLGILLVHGRWGCVLDRLVVIVRRTRQVDNVFGVDTNALGLSLADLLLYLGGVCRVACLVVLHAPLCSLRGGSAGTTHIGSLTSATISRIVLPAFRDVPPSTPPRPRALAWLRRFSAAARPLRRPSYSLTRTPLRRFPAEWNPSPS